MWEQKLVLKVRKRQRLFSGDHLKIRPLLRSAPIVLCTPEVFTRKPNMHPKLEHIFVYGWGAQHHRAVSYPIRKLTGFPPLSKVPVISTWHSFFSYSTVAMVGTVFGFFLVLVSKRVLYNVLNMVRYQQKAPVRVVTKATEIASS